MPTIDKLFQSALLEDSDVVNALDNDTEDDLFELLEESRKISIFDSEFILEGDE